MSADLEKIGEKLWDRFNADKLNIEWYYGDVYSKMSDLTHTNIYKEFTVLLKNVFGEKGIK
jgi:hypothetical protein